MFLNPLPCCLSNVLAIQNRLSRKSPLVGEGLVPSQFAGVHKGRGQTLLQRFLDNLRKLILG